MTQAERIQAAQARASELLREMDEEGNEVFDEDETEKDETEEAGGQTTGPTHEADIVELVSGLDEWLLALKRAVAGYSTLTIGLLSAQNRLPPGQRKKGLPIFHYTGSFDSRTALDLFFDMKDLKKAFPEHLPNVLVPMISVQAQKMLEALGEMNARFDLINERLRDIIGVERKKADS